jgi:hypothetical protein
MFARRLERIPDPPAVSTPLSIDLPIASPGDSQARELAGEAGNFQNKPAGTTQVSLNV